VHYKHQVAPALRQHALILELMKQTTATNHRTELPSSHYRISVRITALFLFGMLFFGGVEFGLRVALPDPLVKQLSLTSEIRNKLNTAEENQADLPMYLPRQGGECVREDKSKLHWNPRFGFSSKTLDKVCARKLFASGKVKVVMFGGSTMANVGAVNYLTSLDYYAFGQHEDIASINLAEPGARLSNMLARFMDEVTDLKPDVALFLDGFNEFYSIHLGGRPGDDTHWTVGVRRRVEAPIMSFLDRALNQSRLAQVTLIRTGIFPSSRHVSNQFDLARVDEDVGYYLRARESAEALCAHYQVKCLFILQPITVLEDTPAGSTEAIVRENARYFPHDREMYSRGYALIRTIPGDRYLDASGVLENLTDAYVDVVHLSKVGNEALGKFFYSAVKKVLVQSTSWSH
jgi:hypothetical protein